MSETSQTESTPGSTEPVLVELRRSIEQLTARVEQSIEDDRFKDEQIRRMHAELQQYKQGLLDQALLPVLTQIVRLHENLKRQETALRLKPVEQLGPDRLFKELAGVRDELEVLLSESGVAVFEHPANTYEPSRQVARETTITTEAALHGQISERLLPGYERDGRLIAKERVKVYAHKPAPKSTEPAATVPSTATPATESPAPVSAASA